MDNNKNDNTKNEKQKDAFSNFWQKTSDISKKAMEGAKNLAEQTKKNIHDAQAKKYISVTAKEFKHKSFNVPNVIEIVDDSANRSFITDSEAIGWIEVHEGIDVLHMYSEFVKKCNLQFVPLPQRDNVYCKDNFDSNKFINSNRIFGKSTEEKLAELEHIAYCLGAKNCSIEILETDSETNSKARSIKSSVELDVSSYSKNRNAQSGKTVSRFQGHDNPTKPELKWFLHDDNIQRLIEMRCTDTSSIKSKILELNGSTSVTMSKKIACAIDDVLNIKGGFSMENQAIKEYSSVLIYEIEF